MNRQGKLNKRIISESVLMPLTQNCQHHSMLVKTTACQSWLARFYIRISMLATTFGRCLWQKACLNAADGCAVSLRQLFICCFLLLFLPPTTEEVYVFVHTPEFVCLSVSKITQKMRAWIWMTCCVSTDVGTRKNWLTFEPDPDHSSDAGTGFLSPIAYALQ